MEDINHILYGTPRLNGRFSCKHMQPIRTAFQPAANHSGLLGPDFQDIGAWLPGLDTLSLFLYF